MILFCLALLPVLFWEQGTESAAQLKQAGITQVAVPVSLEAAWKAQDSIAVRTADPKTAVELVKPSVEFRINEASASRSPWIDANGWRIIRNAGKTFYYKAPGQAAALAAAEAFMYGADALVETDVAGLQPLAEMLGFLAKIDSTDRPAVANIGFIDDGTDEAGEVMNMMARRNLLFRVVTKPDSRLNLNVKLGTAKYSRDDAVDAAAFAQRLRSELTDEKRALRIYGSEVVLGRLTGDRQRLRAHLLNYAAATRPVRSMRVRVLGRYPKHEIHVFGAPGAALSDYELLPDATEFTVTDVKSYAVVDLAR